MIYTTFTAALEAQGRVGAKLNCWIVIEAVTDGWCLRRVV